MVNAADLPNSRGDAKVGCFDGPDMDVQGAWATAHVLAAVTALVAGLAALRARKGTYAHRATGTVYGVALVLVNGAALSLHRESTFGVFHALAVISLGTLVVGLAPLVLGKRSAVVVAIHAYCMTWSYAGLAAAGIGQLAVAVGDGRSPWLVPVMIATVLCISAVVIRTKVPSALGRVPTG